MKYENMMKKHPKLKNLLKNVGIGNYNFKENSGSQMLDTLSEKEILTDGKMKSLFGEMYRNVVCFNFDSQCWNRPTYMGFSMGNQNIDTRNALDMKRLIENEPNMQGMEVVASVTMATADDQYPGDGLVTPCVKYKRSSNIVGTLLLRDKATGRILPVQPCWLGVEAYPKMSVAAFFGADGMAYKLANNGLLRGKFVSELMRQVQR